MKEIKLYGRGGQGTVTASKILVAAAVAEGGYGQSVPSFGQERQGAPVFTYARLDDRPIDVHSFVYHPDAVVVFDAVLPELGVDLTAGAKKESILLWNLPYTGQGLDRPLPAAEDAVPASIAGAFGQVALVDAWEITRALIGRVPPNAAMIGALARATGWLKLESVLDALADYVPPKVLDKNVEAARLAYERTVVARHAAL